METFKPDSHEYAAALYERAFQIWCATGRNGSRVERLLEDWAKAQTPDGAEIPPVPASQTINAWARTDDWEGRWLRSLVAELPMVTLRMRVDTMRLGEAAVQDLYDCKSGRYNDDPKLRSAIEKGAHETLKMLGLGTFGANQGGVWMIGAQEVLAALGEGEKTATEESPAQTSRTMRDAIAAEKRGSE